jgi:hypothetical protein
VPHPHCRFNSIDASKKKVRDRIGGELDVADEDAGELSFSQCFTEVKLMGKGSMHDEPRRLGLNHIPPNDKMRFLYVNKDANTMWDGCARRIGEWNKHLPCPQGDSLAAQHMRRKADKGFRIIAREALFEKYRQHLIAEDDPARALIWPHESTTDESAGLDASFGGTGEFDASFGAGAGAGTGVPNVGSSAMHAAAPAPAPAQQQQQQQQQQRVRKMHISFGTESTAASKPPQRPGMHKKPTLATTRTATAARAATARRCGTSGTRRAQRTAAGTCKRGAGRLGSLLGEQLAGAVSAVKRAKGLNRGRKTAPEEGAEGGGAARPPSPPPPPRPALQEGAALKRGRAYSCEIVVFR